MFMNKVNEDVGLNKTYLSDVPTGNKCVIVKVGGYGSFRHRLMQMGFIKGEIITVVKNAPLKDPIEYIVMGSHVSLRRNEAEHIEVTDISNYKPDDSSVSTITEEIRNEVDKKSKVIDVALVGNPNCGKTSFFNFATGMREKVGNYTGVTVNAKVGTFMYKGYTINMIDLPGTYSITEFSHEEKYVRKYIMEEHPDVVLNVVDATNLERNLFLTTQLIDMNVRIVMALNMYDEFEKHHDKLDHEYLGEMLGFNIVPTAAFKGMGINEVLEKIIDAYEDKKDTHRHIHINYGTDIENAILEVKGVLPTNHWITDHYAPRYLSLKLIENDSSIMEMFEECQNYQQIKDTAEKVSQKISQSYKEDATTVITNAKYGFIRGALKETFTQGNEKQNISTAIDYVLTNKWLGFPILILFLYLMFQATFSLGAYPQEWIESAVGWLSDWVSNIMPDGFVEDLVVDGIIGGVGSVLVFLPNILILFFFISIMEDTGYMARAAFIMDKLMHKIGLHGKSFIPLLIGFGCSVPAVMATRILDNKKNRILTMLIVPLMSCSARLPVYILMVSAFFHKYQALILLSMYIIGVLIAVLFAFILNKTIFKGKSDNFVLELPPYRVPTFRNVSIHIWDKAAGYLKKISSVILVASVVIWLLEYFPRTNKYIDDIDNQIVNIQSNPVQDAESQAQIMQLEREKMMLHKEYSYIGRIGKFFEPVMRPLGFNWKMTVSLLTGVAAKEVAVSTLGILYGVKDADNNHVSLVKVLKEDVHTTGELKGEKVLTPLVAFCYMLFVLLYFPCVATIATIKKEYGTNWAIFVVVYTVALAWLVSFGVYNIGSLF